MSVEADGFAPASLDVELSESSDPVQVVLQRGGLLRLRVVDKSGRPVAGARVNLSPSVSGSGLGGRQNRSAPANRFPPHDR